MSVILMTTLFYKALILQGEIWCWSLLGLKGLKHAFSSHSSQYISHGTNKEKLNNNPDRLADQFLISLMFD